MKSEPSVFSIENLKQAKDQTTCWDGVRNYQARNYLRDAVNVGDRVLFYHSNADPSGIAGEAVVVRGTYPDDTAFDPTDLHYDPKSRPANPTWYMVDVKWVQICKNIISLTRLRQCPTLRDMMVLKKGSRLSVQPVTQKEWTVIMKFPEWN